MRWRGRLFPLWLVAAAGLAPAARGIIPPPTPARLALSYGMQSLRSYKLADAEEGFREAILLEPLEVDAHQYLGITLIVAGCRAEGLQALWTAAGLRTRSAKYRVSLATDLLRFGLVDEAEEFMRDAIRVEPTNAVGYHNLVQLLHQLGRPIEALEVAQLAVRAVPGDASCRVEYAQLLLELGCLAAGEEVLREAVALDPKLSGAQYQLAIVLTQRGETNGVEEILREALKWDETMAEGHHQLGLLLLHQGRVQEAIDTLKRARELYDRRGDTRSTQALDQLIGELWKLLP